MSWRSRRVEICGRGFEAVTLPFTTTLLLLLITICVSALLRALGRRVRVPELRRPRSVVVTVVVFVLSPADALGLRETAVRLLPAVVLVPATLVSVEPLETNVLEFLDVLARVPALDLSVGALLVETRFDFLPVPITFTRESLVVLLADDELRVAVERVVVRGSILRVTLKEVAFVV